MTPYQKRKLAERKKLIEQVKTYRGWSIFWVTENDVRARVATKMIKDKEITADRRGYCGYPWSAFKLKKGLTE